MSEFVLESALSRADETLSIDEPSLSVQKRMEDFPGGARCSSESLASLSVY
jgi:hypothetical protein